MIKRNSTYCTMFNRSKWKRKEKLTCNVIFIKVNLGVRGRENDSEVANAIVLLTIMKRTWHVKIDKRNNVRAHITHQFSFVCSLARSYAYVLDSILACIASAMFFIHAWRRKKKHAHTWNMIHLWFFWSKSNARARNYNIMVMVWPLKPKLHVTRTNLI